MMKIIINFPPIHAWILLGVCCEGTHLFEGKIVEKIDQTQ